MVTEREIGGEVYRHRTVLLLYEQPKQQSLICVNDFLILSIEFCVRHIYSQLCVIWIPVSSISQFNLKQLPVSQLVLHNSSTSSKSKSGPYSQAVGLIDLQDILKWKGRRQDTLPMDFACDGNTDSRVTYICKSKGIFAVQFTYSLMLFEVLPQCRKNPCILTSVQAFCVRHYCPALPKKNVNFNGEFH